MLAEALAAARPALPDHPTDRQTYDYLQARDKWIEVVGLISSMLGEDNFSFRLHTFRIACGYNALVYPELQEKS